MVFKLISQVLVASLTLSVKAACSGVSQPVLPLVRTEIYQPQATVFKCIPYGSNLFATVAQRHALTAPLFLWNRDHFGPELTPQLGCNIVSQRLNYLVANQGGSLKDLLLTMGRVNGTTVICLVNNFKNGCNTSNTLFTLRPEDAFLYARRPHEFLERLTGISIQDSASAIFRFTGSPIEDNFRQFYFSLSAWEKSIFRY